MLRKHFILSELLRSGGLERGRRGRRVEYAVSGIKANNKDENTIIILTTIRGVKQNTA